MKSASLNATAIVVVTMAVMGTLFLTLWRLVPAVEDTSRALYHLIWGLCRRSFMPGRVELYSIVAIAISSLLAIVVARVIWYLSCRVRRTRAVMNTLVVWRGGTAASPSWMSAYAMFNGHPIDVVEHPAPFALCSGLFAPRVCISTGLLCILTPREIEAVILHECHHRARRDPLVMLIAGALVHGVFFLPVLRDLLRRYEVTKEFDADDFAMRVMGERVSLAAALYKVLTSAYPAPDLRGAAVGTLSVEERRIRRLVEASEAGTPAIVRSRATLSGITVAGAAVLFAVSLFSQAQPLLHACRL